MACLSRDINCSVAANARFKCARDHRHRHPGCHVAARYTRPDRLATTSIFPRFFYHRESVLISKQAPAHVSSLAVSDLTHLVVTAMALSQPYSNQQQQQHSICLRSFIPLHMRTAAAAAPNSKSPADLCEQSSSATVLCSAAKRIRSAVDTAIESAGKSAGCLVEWALRVCDDKKFENHW